MKKLSELLCVSQLLICLLTAVLYYKNCAFIQIVTILQRSGVQPKACRWVLLHNPGRNLTSCAAISPLAKGKTVNFGKLVRSVLAICEKCFVAFESDVYREFSFLLYYIWAKSWTAYIAKTSLECFWEGIVTEPAFVGMTSMGPWLWCPVSTLHSKNMPKIWQKRVVSGPTCS